METLEDVTDVKQREFRVESGNRTGNLMQP